MNKRVIIGGGGTGGHVFPAISIANALKEMLPEVELLFVGALGKIEMEKVPEAGFRIEGLPVEGLQRKISLKLFSFLFRLWKSMRMAGKIIKNFRPHAVVGVGGYASGPIVRAAISERIPVILQEQNSYAGITNRLLGRSAKKICVAYDGMGEFFPEERIVITGNPVRKDIIIMKGSKSEALVHFGFKEIRETILILGGSLGARTINKSVIAALESIPNDVCLIWQTGKNYYENALKVCRESGADNVSAVDFISRMDLAYLAADIIISRAGAGTISELAVVGKPVILVPSPNVAEDHQTRNAMALVRKNAAIMIRDQQAETSLMAEALRLVRDSEQREQLSANIKSIAIPDSAERIAAEIIEIIK